MTETKISVKDLISMNTDSAVVATKNKKETTVSKK